MMVNFNIFLLFTKTKKKGLLCKMPFEHIPHTADVMFHVWASTLESCLEDCVMAFTSVLVDDPSTVNIDNDMTIDVTARGRDLEDALYHLLDEFLFAYGSTYVVCSMVRVFEVKSIIDNANTTEIHARAWGEKYDQERHAGGTEIKAVTKHDLMIRRGIPGAESGEDKNDTDWHATFVLDI
eukprot:PhM_4_TR8004/c0_g1_i3/m.57676